MVAALLYGPDRGLVRERAVRLAKTVVDAIDDPFRVVHLTVQGLKADPPRLADEAAALSLGGGRRVVWVRDADDGITSHFSDFFRRPVGDALVIVEAAELAKRSSLRRLFEESPSALAVACYNDDSQNMRSVITETLGRQGMTASPDTVAFLLGNLGSDRQVTRNELEKLACYVGRPGPVSLEDAMACVGDAAAVTLDDVVYAAASGDVRRMDQTLTRAFSEGIQTIAVIRAAIRHFQRLHLVAGQVDRGTSLEKAMAALRPPPLFTVADRFRSQVRQWPSGRIAHALNLLTEAEINCKSTGMPAEAICTRALLRIAQAARSPASRVDAGPSV